MKWYDYGYLEEIEVQREDRLFNLERDVIFDLGVALQMFTKRIVILKRVEDLQLGFKSYQKKLNITKPETFSKPLPLIMVQGRQVVPVDYFINNDLEYLKGGSSSKKYTTSTTKTKVAKYDIPCIEDMVPSSWSPVKVAYDKYVVWGISHWAPK
nr:hypothetical protein [Tanacetum cinerariifolium]